MAEIFNFLAYKEAEDLKKDKAGQGSKENRRREEEPNFSDKINCNKLTELSVLVDHLMSKIVDSSHREAYQAKLDSVNSYSNAEIIGWINNFYEKEVDADPLFYSALLEAAGNRQLIREYF